jgi:RNA polymerase sigma-70 factor (ECF subfamily)
VRHSSKILAEESVADDDCDTGQVMKLTPQEFESFIKQAVTDHESSLIGYARTYLYDLDRARDVVQDTFIRLCKQDPEKVEVHLKSWLFTVCRNRCFDIMRKDKRIESLDDVGWQKISSTEESPDQKAEHGDEYFDVMRYMDRLSDNQKEVILLKFQQGLSYEEIHRVTGLTHGNIGFLIHAGLKRLRGWMLEKGDADEN